MKFLREKYTQIVDEDLFVTKKAPKADLHVYPEFIEALSSVEDDFFRTPLKEEERKHALDALLVSKKPEKISKIPNPFLQRHQKGHQGSISSNSAAIQVPKAAVPVFDPKNHIYQAKFH
ncbi:hypothetical protein AYI68_g4389 [Smittium mucronatum]|uniref:Uncharacterized protein n=1 Tax=Smittium mucronatum TaxID=133383 RepID=A0A1R0GX76_9FUNG|nr:hypothetical protein AYI68_g4389 [Smittium mucronatum]